MTCEKREHLARAQDLLDKPASEMTWGECVASSLLEAMQASGTIQQGVRTANTPAYNQAMVDDAVDLAERLALKLTEDA
jgi:hypothetical protein